MKHIKEPKPIRNKYDLMHTNTPSFASTVVTWDCSKLTPITFKRIISWIDKGAALYNSGDAAAMYREIRRRFDLPEFVVRNYKGNPTTRGSSGYIRWENASANLLQAINVVYQSERVIDRLDGANSAHYYQPWYLQSDTLGADEGYFYMNNVHDLTDINKHLAELVNSSEIKAKREQAIEFVKSGGKIQFSWR